MSADTKIRTTRLSGKPLAAKTIRRQEQTSAAVVAVRRILKGHVNVQVTPVGPDTARIELHPESLAIASVYRAVSKHPRWSVTPLALAGRLILYVTKDMPVIEREYNGPTLGQYAEVHADD